MPLGKPITPPVLEPRRKVQAVTVDTAFAIGVDTRYFDHLALTIAATRNSGAETLTVYREEAMAVKNWKRMEQLVLFAGSGSYNAALPLRHRMFRLYFDVSAEPADYSLEVAWTLRRRLGNYENHAGGYLEI